MWDKDIVKTVDRRGDSVPPMLVRYPRHQWSMDAPRGFGWRVAPTGSDEVVLSEVIGTIDKARDIVAFSSFLLSDRRVQEALLAAAQRGCRVYGLIAAEAKLDRDMEDDDDFSKKTTEAHIQMLNEFANRALIRSSPSFHAKCVLADPGTKSAAGVLLTANLTTEALTRNEELAVRLNATEVSELFEQLRFAFWELAERELFDKGQLNTVKPLGEVKLPPAARHAVATIGGRCLIREGMLEMIQKAQKEIWVASFGWDIDHVVVKTLCKRANDGLPVKVLARYRPSALPALLSLRRSGASVLCFKWLHAKALVCDGEAMVMSANLQRHGLDEGFELGVRLSQADAEELREVLVQWFKGAEWRLEIPAKLGDVEGQVVPLPPNAVPRELVPVVVQRSDTLDLGKIQATSVDRLDEAALSEQRLREEIDRRGMKWVHEVQVRYVIEAPRLPSAAKRLEVSKKAGERKDNGTAGPRVFKLPSGEKAIGVATKDEVREAIEKSKSLGVKSIMVEMRQQ